MDLEEGKILVKLARNSIKLYFDKKEPELKEKFLKEKKGVFVTLYTLDYQLRGCIGFSEPIYELGNAIIKAAKLAAFSDSRFIPLKKEELNYILIEVSVLTKPKLIKIKNPNEYLKKIEIGKDGLIVEADSFKGLLLPIVPIEQKWSVEEFLNHTCIKAGLLENTWKQKQCKVYKFQAEVFAEEKPNGNIIKKQ